MSGRHRAFQKAIAYINNFNERAGAHHPRWWYLLDSDSKLLMASVILLVAYMAIILHGRGKERGEGEVSRGTWLSFSLSAHIPTCI
jgi:hypothetical protein